ncbi:MAG TPA: LL-diaminopimelate aminotransferase [Anaeromyxobacter sp.]|nr:LL-diaminopimelate aminotransferase [Anaeromyxobacter sp.]
MARNNQNYDKLASAYLFQEVARRARAFAEQNPGVELLRLGIGDTTLPLTPAVVAGLKAAAEKLGTPEGYTGYGDYEGERWMREALALVYLERGVSLELSEIFVSDGAKSDSANIQSLFAADSVVAIQDPAYPVYVDSNVMAGRTGDYDPARQQYRGIVYMPCTEENGFFPELPREKVDLVYLCSPNNPTGAVATHAQLARLVEWARASKAVILFDAAYAAFIRDPSLPQSIYEIPAAKSCAIELNSFSKMAGFTGVRLGWAVVPKELVVEGCPPGKLNAMWYRRQSTFFNGPSNVVQAGGAAALSPQGRAECRAMVDRYLENARIIRQGLADAGLSCVGGTNAPYVWARAPGKMSSWDFFDLLLNQAHVVVTPGSGFGPSGEGYVRLSAFGRRGDTERAVAAVRAVLARR